MAVVNVRPSGVHTAPVSPQAGDGASDTVTASCEEGSTRIFQWSRRPALRRSFFTAPPVTPSSARMCLREPCATGASKVSSSQNLPDPSCSAGTDTKLAVSGGNDAGPGTLRPSPVDSIRPSDVHSAPISAHARPAETRIETAPGDDGSTVNSQRSDLSSTRCASVTAPPITVSA